jgi:hypothetical protein
MNIAKIKTFMAISMPFMLVFGTLNMLIIVGVSGIHRDLLGAIFRIDITMLSIPSSEFTGLTNISVSDDNNVTATSLGLSDKYAFYLWNYASTAGSETTFHSSNFDYVDKLNLSEISIDGVTSPLPNSLANLKSRLRNEIRFAQMAFLAATFNAFLVLAVGIAACFNLKFRALIVQFFNIITLATMLVFSALVTAAGLGATESLKSFKTFGLNVEIGNMILGIVWVAVIHMIAVCIMWFLMAIGVMRMNPAVKSKALIMTEDEESQQGSGGGSLSLTNRGPNHSE